MAATKLGEIIPAVDAGRVHVVEGEPHGVISDRLDFGDHDMALAWHGLALVRRMTLHLGARAFDPQIFGGKLETLAILEGDRKRLAVLAEL